MAFTQTEIPGLRIFTPLVFTDSRGAFFEAYNKNLFTDNNINLDFVQDNHSISQFGVVRGLHFQRPPFAQTKLVRVIEGTINDVVIDLRKNSPTFRRVFSIVLSEENKLQLLIPKGFAHGFSVVSPRAQVLYKCDVPYNKESEAGINYSDRGLKIDWKLEAEEIVVSEKDAALPEFDSFGGDFGFQYID